MTYGEVLSHFKKTESPEVLVALIEDPILRRALVLCPSLKIEWITPIGDLPAECKTENQQWEWLWSKVKVDRAGISALDKDLTSGARVFRKLRGMRLIYPDGSVNNMAQQYLRSIVATQLNRGKAGKDAKK